MDARIQAKLVQPGGLAVALQQSRLSTGLSGKEFAEALGWDPAKLSRTESGQRLMTLAELAHWIGVAKVDAEPAATMQSELRLLLELKLQLRGQRRITDRFDQVEFPGAREDVEPRTLLEAYQRGYADALKDVQMQLARLAVPSASELSGEKADQ